MALTEVGRSGGAVSNASAELIWTVTLDSPSDTFQYGDQILLGWCQAGASSVSGYSSQGLQYSVGRNSEELGGFTVGLGGGSYTGMTGTVVGGVGDTSIVITKTGTGKAIAAPAIVLRGHVGPYNRTTAATNAAVGASPRTQSQVSSTALNADVGTGTELVCYALAGVYMHNGGTSPAVAAISNTTDIGSFSGTPSGFAGAFAVRSGWGIRGEGLTTFPALSAVTTWVGGTNERGVIHREGWSGDMEDAPDLGTPSFTTDPDNPTLLVTLQVHSLIDFDSFFDTDPFDDFTGNRWNDRVAINIDWGDGDDDTTFADTGTTHFHTYAVGGTSYHVTVTATDLFGEIDVYETDATVGGAPPPVREYAPMAVDLVPKDRRIGISELPYQVDSTMEEGDLWP